MLSHQETHVKRGEHERHANQAMVKRQGTAALLVFVIAGLMMIVDRNKSVATCFRAIAVHDAII